MNLILREIVLMFHKRLVKSEGSYYLGAERDKYKNAKSHNYKTLSTTNPSSVNEGRFVQDK